MSAAKSTFHWWMRTVLDEGTHEARPRGRLDRLCLSVELLRSGGRGRDTRWPPTCRRNRHFIHMSARHVGAPTCRRPRRHLQTNFAPDQGAVVAADTWRIRRRRADTARPTLVDTGAASTGTSGLDGQGGRNSSNSLRQGCLRRISGDLAFPKSRPPRARSRASRATGSCWGGVCKNKRN